ncbi:PREDICTED: uncharacterized protein LOC109213484 [Nicotiana attenuata]|uniref:Uncharacterized protein n=1 Tax=Nicotiana attenuata TaxID=49451 RepID=A0A1J6KGJ1_NICAT|nr:PREDICTED: uncharacterized protein LOC109213484 [Nicotiana attenuata]OIT27788.1 hypothetical protein A4A49_24620 [Nicotiana attenuata]
MVESTTMATKLEEQLVNMEEEKGDEKPRELFFAELNLVLILSFLSLSSEERNFEKLEIDNDKDHQEDNIVSKVNFRKRGMNNYRTTEPQVPRFQTKIRDCGHCRRM